MPEVRTASRRVEGKAADFGGTKKFGMVDRMGAHVCARVGAPVWVRARACARKRIVVT